MKSVQERIRHLIKKSGESQRFISEKTGIVQSTMSAYCTGRMEPTPAAMYKIAKYFNVEYEWLRTGDKKEMLAITTPINIVEPKPLISDINYSEIRKIVKEELAACTEADELTIAIQKLPVDKIQIIRTIVKSFEGS